MAETSPEISSFCSWLDASPTPFHVVATARDVLVAGGFAEHRNLSDGLSPKGFLAVDGAIVAWSTGAAGAPLRIVGAHTDSPNLRLQPNPDILSHGWAQLGVEIYGGVLLNSWLDRDLGLAGRVIAADGSVKLFDAGVPLARVPQLAIHLDREINERGLMLDRHQHTVPVWGVNAPTFSDWLAGITGVASVAAFDAHLYDVQKSGLLGHDSDFLVSGRLDNQLSCWAAIHALVGATSSYTCIAILNDHEEVGSDSVTGAGGPLLENVVGALLEARGLGAAERSDILRDSWCLSADNAHAVHPNYRERHEARHSPLPNCGVALKVNGNQRYATSARGAAHLRTLAGAAHVPLQTFVSRNNMPCGSTIGPITATRLGIEAIDVGVPQLSMHSAREMCGSDDPKHLLDLAKAFFAA